MVVFVQGPHDGHILLSSAPNTNEKTKKYEIGNFSLKVKFHFHQTTFTFTDKSIMHLVFTVIGGWDNTVSYASKSS